MVTDFPSDFLSGRNNVWLQHILCSTTPLSQRMEEIDQEIEEMPDDLEDPVMWETETGKFLSDLLSVFIFEAQLSNAIFINYKSTPDFGSSKQGTNFYNIAMFVVFFLDPFAFEIILEIN